MTKVDISLELMSQPRLPRKSNGGKSLGAWVLTLYWGLENPGEQEGRMGERKYARVFPLLWSERVSPRFCSNPCPQCDGVRRWSVWEVIRT